MFQPCLWIFNSCNKCLDLLFSGLIYDNAGRMPPQTQDRAEGRLFKTIRNNLDGQPVFQIRRGPLASTLEKLRRALQAHSRLHPPPPNLPKGPLLATNGPKMGFFVEGEGLMGVRFKKSTFWIQKVYFRGIPHLLKINPGYGPGPSEKLICGPEKALKVQDAH